MTEIVRSIEASIEDCLFHEPDLHEMIFYVGDEIRDRNPLILKRDSLIIRDTDMFGRVAWWMDIVNANTPITKTQFENIFSKISKAWREKSERKCELYHFCNSFKVYIAVVIVNPKEYKGVPI